MVYISVGATASEATIEELKAVINAYSERARKENGCVEIAIKTVELKVTLNEKWTGQAVYAFHESQPETIAFASKLRELIVQPLEHYGYSEMPVVI